jgi:hypothetical protein
MPLPALPPMLLPALALLALLLAAVALARPAETYCDAGTEFVQTTEPRCPKGYTNIGIVRIIRKGVIQKRCQSNACHAVRPETVPR